MQKRTADNESRFRVMDSGYTGEWADERSKGPYRDYKGWVPKTALARRDALVPHFRQLDWSYVEMLVERYYVHTPIPVSEASEGHYRSPLKNRRELVLPKHADGGLLVFPKLKAVLKCIHRPKKSWEPLNVALEYILSVLKELYPSFSDWTNGFVGPESVRLIEATARYLANLDAETPGDVLVLPFQAGAMFAGYTVRSSIGHMEALKCHVPAHDFANLCFAASDGDRFVEGALFADCPGSERTQCGGADFSRTPFVCMNAGVRGFGSHDIDEPNCNAGSCSFVVPLK